MQHQQAANQTRRLQQQQQQQQQQQIINSSRSRSSVATALVGTFARVARYHPSWPIEVPIVAY
jgi:hypothetical protein